MHSRYKKISESEDYRKINIQNPTDLSKVIDIKNFSMMICSKRRTGKSVFMKDLLSQIYQNYADCYIFSNTIEHQEAIYDFVRKDKKVKGYNEELLQDIYSKQEYYVKSQMAKRPKNVDEAEYKKGLDHVMLIFDDIISDPGVRKSKVFQNLFILGRHINLCVIVISQYYSSLGGISIVARKNLDYIVSFFLDSQSDKEHLIDDFMSKNDRREGLQLYTDITTQEYQCIILCNSINSTNYEDYVFKYTARLKVPKFEIANKVIDTREFIVQRDNKPGHDPKDPIEGLTIRFGKPKTSSLWQ